MVTGTNNEGYKIALRKCFDSFDKFFSMPTKGALTQARDKVLYTFFEDRYKDMKNHFKNDKIRRKYKGLNINSVDGDVYSIPRNKKNEKKGFYGQGILEDKESHSLKMYTVFATDVFSGIPMEFAYGTKCRELELAMSFIHRLGKKSLAVYDRLYFSRDLVSEHNKNNNYFLCRVKKDLNAAKELFFGNKRNNTTIINGVEVRLVKIINPKNKEPIVLATNLSRKKFTNIELSKIYIKRWESETANRDTTHTLKLEQFHSKNINGILQEIFTLLWFTCYSKMELVKNHKIKSKELLNDEYSRPSFKEAADFIIGNIKNILFKFSRKAYKKLQYIIFRSVEKRKHNSRSNPRINKNIKIIYKNNYSDDRRPIEFILYPERMKNQVFQMNHC